MFNRGDLVKFAPDWLCTDKMNIDLRGVIGRIENVTAKGYGVYFRFNGRDYRYEFPAFVLISVVDNVVNRSHVAGQTSVELTKDGLFMKFDDGTMYDFKGERYRPGVQGISEETAQELINRMSAIRSHVSPFERIVFGGGRDYGKSWLKDWLETERKVVEDIVTNKKMPSFVAPRYVLKMDLDKVYAKMPEPEQKPESKMTKDRCIKLLESYRAEREKVAKGRKFERCLRDDVVNEALEKAIELLKNG